MNGKGDKQRPRQISQEEWDRRWQLAFNKKNEERRNKETNNSVSALESDNGNTDSEVLGKSE